MNPGAPRPSAMLDYFTTARRNRYIVTAFFANLAVWCFTALALAIAPGGYISEWSLIIPSGDADTNVSLSNIGQASATSRSQYDSRSLDPRVNYRAIMLSETVLQNAAARLGIGAAQLGRPQVKLLEQSSVIEVRSTGRDAADAQARANAVFRAFQERLSQLRADEAVQRDKGIEEAIRTSRLKLEEAQRSLVEFKVGSKIVSGKQIDESLRQITSLQQRRIELQGQIARANQYVAKLSSSLGLPPESAGLVMTLQADALFVQHFQQFTTAATELPDFRSKWGPNHPQVQGAERRHKAALEALTLRARAITQRDLPGPLLQALSINGAEKSQEPLFRELVSSSVQLSAQRTELTEVERQYRELRGHLDGLAKESSTLDDLERRLKFAEAIFTSVLGKIDVGRTNIFSSYPLIQMLVTPTLPERRSLANLMFGLAGALFCSIFISVGLTLAWLRKKNA